MKKAIVVTGMLLLLSEANLSAQAPDTLWTKIYGGINWDEGSSVQQTSDGGYIITGFTRSFGAGYADIYLIKTDANGNAVWTKTYGGSEPDFGKSVQQTSDGGYIVAGYTASFSIGWTDVYLIKTNTHGDTLWTKTYGGADRDFCFSVQQTSDSGFIIAGYTESFGAGAQDVYLIKTDAQGDTLWTKTYGTAYSEYGYSVQQTIDSGYIIAGASGLGAGLTDVYLIKTDINGDTLWTKTVGGTNYEYGFSVQQTSDGGYIVTGWTRSFGAGWYDVYLIKTNADGDTLWTKTYGGPDADAGSSVQQTSDGGYIIAGQTSSFGAGASDIYLIKTDAQGDTLWTKTIGGTNSDIGTSIQQTSEGGYIIAGWTRSFSADSVDVYLIKLEGNMGIEEEIPSPKSEKEQETFSSFDNVPTFFRDGITLKFARPAHLPIKITLFNVYGARVFVKSLPYTPSSLILKDEKIYSLTSGIYFLSASYCKRELGRIKLIKF